ncbi:MAG: Trk system potassium transporter TrkA [Actinomycetota bacterium]|nr:Trk system potassium transporter TrkA [Actinomycetota bacterium]
MRVIVVGAGHVGATIVDALHGQHDLTVIDLDQDRLTALSHRYDVRTVRGNSASRRILQEAGVAKTDLVLASTARDEINLVTAVLVKRLSAAQTVVRTTQLEYLEAWRERELDVDFVVSSELEVANAVSSTVGVPAARQTDLFADGQVQVVEFDIAPSPWHHEVVGRPLREASLPPESRVAGIIRGDRMVMPRGGESLQPGDRVVVIASPSSARQWSQILSNGAGTVGDVVVFGAGQLGSAVARVLLERAIAVRLVEPDAERAREVAAEIPQARVFHSSGRDADFLQRERIGRAAAGVFCLADDETNLYAAVLAKLHGVRYSIGVIDAPASVPVFEAAGVDVAINPRTLTAEEMIRFAHDPRLHQLAMLEGNRFEILDMTVRADSPLAGKAFRELPDTGSHIGAVVRHEQAIFPHGDDVLKPGDRVIVFVESSRSSLVEGAL